MVHRQRNRVLQFFSNRVLQFFKTVPGILAGAAAAITAIGVIVAAFNRVVERPPRFETTALKVLPMSLRRLVGRDEFSDTLSWFHVRVANRSRKPLNLAVVFRIRGASNQTPEPIDIPTVEAGTTGERNVNPSIDLLRDDVDAANPDLELSWKITDEGKVVLQGRNMIRILPSNVVDWNLTSRDGKPAPARFLLAALTSWTVSVDEAVRRETAELASNADLSGDREVAAGRWFELCYNRNFRGPMPIAISTNTTEFPTATPQPIRTAAEVLRTRRASPLEAALHMAALTRVGFRMKDAPAQPVLLAVKPGSTSAGAQTLLLAWCAGDASRGLGCWHALDLRQANNQDFAENEREASQLLRHLLSGRPEILTALAKDGLFVEESWNTAALDFVGADRALRITGW